jgi:hypothetical protein
VYFDGERTSGTLNGDKSRLDGDLDYFVRIRLVGVLQSSSPSNVLPCAISKLFFPASPRTVSHCAGETIVLTTLGDGQGLAGMNVLHLGRIVLS